MKIFIILTIIIGLALFESAFGSGYGGRGGGRGARSYGGGRGRGYGKGIPLQRITYVRPTKSVLPYPSYRSLRPLRGSYSGYNSGSYGSSGGYRGYGSADNYDLSRPRLPLPSTAHLFGHNSYSSHSRHGSHGYSKGALKTPITYESLYDNEYEPQLRGDVYVEEFKDGEVISCEEYDGIEVGIRRDNSY